MSLRLLLSTPCSFQRGPHRLRTSLGGLALCLVLGLGCSSSDADGDGGSGGSPTAGLAGWTSSGGSAAGGQGAGASGRGGAINAGGTVNAGGAVNAGGNTNSGGRSGLGGAVSTGGTAVSGGTMGSGGGSGRAGRGGSSSGGNTSSGGTSSGGSGTGGNTSSGGATTGSGGAGVGGSTTSGCGPDTLNPNPFGCEFAWGLSDPGGDLSGFGFLQFMTFWVDWGIGADGSIGTCNGCTWVQNLASTDIIPVYYAYIIGYYAHANGIVDGNQCPADNPNCPNLTVDGAAFVKEHRSTIIQAYADYAKQTYAVWPTKPLLWLLEGDFVQFSYSDQSSPYSMTEVAQLAADITCAIKANMPNAVVGINHSTWNTNDVTDSYWNAMKSVGVRYDFAWTTGVANNNGFFNSDVNSSTYNAATATYSYLHQVSGAKILVDDGCGGNVDEDWSPSSASTLNSLIGSGVMAFNHCASLASDYQSLITAIEPQLNSTCN